MTTPAVPNHALQRTEAGEGRLFCFPPLFRQPLSLSLAALGPRTSTMKQPRSERMAANADKYERRSQSASDKDHPTWLLKRAVRLRKRIPAQERAFEHKQNQQKDRQPHRTAARPA